MNRNPWSNLISAATGTGWFDLSKYKPTDLSDYTVSMLRKTGEALTRCYGPAAQKLAAHRGKGTDKQKKNGADRSAAIEAEIKRIGAELTDRGLAQKIARALKMNRSTVSRHLNKLKKQK